MSFMARMNISDAAADGGGSGGGGAFTVTCFPTAMSNSSSGGYSGLLGPSTATPSGGVSPYTYAWTVFANTGDSGSPNVTSPTAASSTFSVGGVLGQDTGSGTILMTCTDSVGATATAAITVSHFNTDIAP